MPNTSISTRITATRPSQPTGRRSASSRRQARISASGGGGNTSPTLRSVSRAPAASRPDPSTIAGPPAEVTDVVLAASHRYLIEETRQKRPDRVFQRICVLWRRATSEIAGWPQQPISVPCFRKVVSFAWSAFEPSLLAEIEEWKAVVGGGRPFDERAPDKAFRSTTPATQLEQ